MIIAFDSTQHALRAEMLLEYEEIDIDIYPTPKAITAGCALSIHFHDYELTKVQHVISAHHIEIRGIFQQVTTEQYEKISP